MFQSSTRPQPDVVRTGRSWPGGGLGADGLFVYESIKAEGPQCAVSCQLVLSRFHDYISLFIAPVYEFQWLIQVEDAQKQMPRCCCPPPAPGTAAAPAPPATRVVEPASWTEGCRMAGHAVEFQKRQALEGVVGGAGGRVLPR